MNDYQLLIQCFKTSPFYQIIALLLGKNSSLCDSLALCRGVLQLRFLIQQVVLMLNFAFIQSRAEKEYKY